MFEAAALMRVTLKRSGFRARSSVRHANKITRTFRSNIEKFLTFCLFPLIRQETNLFVSQTTDWLEQIIEAHAQGRKG